MSSRARSDGPIRLTKVGLWFLAFLAVVAVAATNTGNNGLFLVVAMMVGTLAVSHVLAGRNVGGLEVAAAAPGEIFAKAPARLEVEVTNGGWIPRWLLVLAIDPRDVEPPAAPRRRSSPLPIPYLEALATARGRIEITPRHRGARRVRRVHVSSLFPLGLFRKGRRYPIDLDLLVYPEILSPAPAAPEQLGQAGEEPTRRAGWGHELFGLRGYRHGDDPRGIHWKQSARTGELIYQERETEENRRLMIVLDNATGKLTPESERAFERRVSEAATAALDYLERQFEVALLTREGLLPHAAGPRQRRAILETLARIEAREAPAAPLAPPGGAAHLYLTLEGEEEAA